MRIAITGSTGLVGSRLVNTLRGNHEILRVVRREAEPDEVGWSVADQRIDREKLEGIDAVVHLAGENIAAGRWNTALKQRIRDSRVQGTRLLSEALAGLNAKPQTLVMASATGFYGDRGDTILDESSARGSGFLADVVEQWEQASEAAEQAGIRVVRLRFGIVLSRQGGALAKMLLPFRLGMGGRVGSGRQYWSWVALDDVVGAIQFALATPALQGAVNVVAPNSVTNLEFTRELGRALHRPTFFPVPAFAARLGLGEMADELLLASARVVPRELESAGYAFQYPKLDAALQHALVS